MPEQSGLTLGITGRGNGIERNGKKCASRAPVHALVELSATRRIDWPAYE